MCPSAVCAPATTVQVVFEQCGKPGGVQVRLLPFAVIGLVVYVLGYPLVVGFILYRNRDQMREDQLLRAMGTGSTRLTNPHGRMLLRGQEPAGCFLFFFLACPAFLRGIFVLLLLRVLSAWRLLLRDVTGTIDATDAA